MGRGPLVHRDFSGTVRRRCCSSLAFAPLVGSSCKSSLDSSSSSPTSCSNSFPASTNHSLRLLPCRVFFRQSPQLDLPPLFLRLSIYSFLLFLFLILNCSWILCFLPFVPFSLRNPSLPLLPPSPRLPPRATPFLLLQFLSLRLPPFFQPAFLPNL